MRKGLDCPGLFDCENYSVAIPRTGRDFARPPPVPKGLAGDAQSMDKLRCLDDRHRTDSSFRKIARDAHDLLSNYVKHRQSLSITVNKEVTRLVPTNLALVYLLTSCLMFSGSHFRPLLEHVPLDKRCPTLNKDCPATPGRIGRIYSPHYRHDFASPTLRPFASPHARKEACRRTLSGDFSIAPASALLETIDQVARGTSRWDLSGCKPATSHSLPATAR